MAYSSAVGIKTSPAENPLGTGSVRPAAACGGVSRICCSSEEPPRLKSLDDWGKNSTLYCPLALRPSESCLLRLELRLQKFEVWGPTFCFLSSILHSQVFVYGHLLSLMPTGWVDAPGCSRAPGPRCPGLGRLGAQTQPVYLLL